MIWMSSDFKRLESDHRVKGRRGSHECHQGVPVVICSYWRLSTLWMIEG